MSDINVSAMGRRSEPIVARGADDATEPVLVMRPKSFFFLRFRLRTGGHGFPDGSIQSAPPPGAPPERGPERIIDFTLLPMILLIGVPILVYCTMFAAR